MEFLNWLTEALQVKILLALIVLGATAIYSMTHAVLMVSPLLGVEGGLTADSLVLPMALMNLSTFSLGAMAGLAKDLLGGGPDKMTEAAALKFADKD